MKMCTTLILIFADNKEVILPVKKNMFFLAKYLVKVYQQLGKQILNSSYEFEMMLTRIATQSHQYMIVFLQESGPPK